MVCVWTFLSEQLSDKDFIELVFENKIKHAKILLASQFSSFFDEITKMGAKGSLLLHAENDSQFQINKSPEIIFLLRMGKIKI